MNEEKAREVLGDCVFGVYCKGFSGAKHWFTLQENKTVSMEGNFTAEQLKAIAWWMENKAK